MGITAGDTDGLHHDASSSSQSDGLSRSIRPGVPVPATVLICEMGGGALFLQGWRDGPGAYVCAEDAALLRQGLAEAFGTEPGNDTTATS